jgi:hypothetical protein
MMAEIKSTLDIILEKAEKYTVTEEEKSAFRRRELESRVKGLVQKYVDGLLDLERLKEEVAAFDAKAQESAFELIRREALERIQPGEADRALLDILSMVGVNTGLVNKLLQDYEKTIGKEKKKGRSHALEELRKRGISGSAVIPNLDADEGWLKVLSEARKAFHEQVTALS